MGIYDRVVIQEILKEIAQTQQVDLNAKQKFKGEPMLSFRSTLLIDHTIVCVPSCRHQ